MPNELKFNRALELAGNFQNIGLTFEILHFNLPKVRLEVDNFAQKGKIAFIFEGKANKEDRAISQLQDRYKSFILHKSTYLKWGHFSDYTSVRLFYYSFQRNLLCEYDSKGKRLTSVKFTDINHLAEILRKL